MLFTIRGSGCATHVSVTERESTPVIEIWCRRIVARGDASSLGGEDTKMDWLNGFTGRTGGGPLTDLAIDCSYVFGTRSTG